MSESNEPIVTKVEYWTDSQNRLREEVTIEYEMSFEMDIPEAEIDPISIPS